jgi:hypothetical protein
MHEGVPHFLMPHERYADYVKNRHGDGGKFIQSVVGSPKFKKGALTAEAKKHGKSAMEFAHEVLAHPDNYSTKTRRRAQFAVNAQHRS